ncbi:MAG: alpha-L-fucosidase [Planctomycetes bacterium]|nr:alpha-L-fucosidase [Planctomycetota bacterium]
MTPLRLSVLAALGACTSPQLPRVPEPRDLPLPTAAQLRWQQAEFGVLVSLDMHTFGDGRYVQQQARVTPVDDVDRFAPAQLDAEQWVLAAKAAGARFAILTASHESGFRLWQSHANPYCLKATRWGDGRRDVVGEFHDACERHGLLPGIYVGTRWNAQLGIYDFRVTERSGISQEQYNRLIEAEVEELCTRYGEWFEFWFDGGAHGPEQGGPDLLSIVAAHQPDAVFYHNLQRADARWGGSESGTVPYPCWATFPFQATGAGESARAVIAQHGFALLKHGDPDGRWWMPAMSDAPLRGHGGHEWFWEPGDERLLQPVDKLVDMYCRSVGHNSTLILGICPDDRGLVPDADVARLAAFGAARERQFAAPVAVADAIAPGAEVELAFGGERSFDLVVLQEDIRHGERVRGYQLQVRQGGRWLDLGTGSCIGHQRIHVLDATATGDALRVVVREARGEPRLLRVAAHRDEADAARRWQQRPR